jgi:hypothetical protein
MNYGNETNIVTYHISSIFVWEIVTVPNFMELMIVKTYECFVKEKLN